MNPKTPPTRGSNMNLKTPPGFRKVNDGHVFYANSSLQQEIASCKCQISNCWGGAVVFTLCCYFQLFTRVCSPRCGRITGLPKFYSAKTTPIPSVEK